jgi:hypothetical protein
MTAQVNAHDNQHTLAAKLRLLLILIATVPGAALIICDVLIPHEKRRTNPLSFGSVRVFDLLDPLFIVPFMSVTLRMVDRICFGSRPRRAMDNALQWLSHFAFVGYIYGSAVHFVSNALNVLATEINDFRAVMPPVIYDLIYFFDEDLGHWVMFLSLFLLIGIYVIACENWSMRSEWDTVTAAVLMGLTWSVGTHVLCLLFECCLAHDFPLLGIIESSHAWMGFAAAGILVAAVACRMYIQGTKGRITPILAFAAALAVALPLGEVIYFVSVGSFAEPSALGGSREVLQLALQRWRHGIARIGSHAI